MKVAVIGAGAAGLAAIKHSIDYNCEVVAFEQTDKVGGTWVYTDRTDKTEFGIDIHSSMYKDLTTNLPTELMCYPNEPYPTNSCSFVPSTVVYDYYQSYADKYQLRDHIKFLHQVIRVRPLTRNHSTGWELIVRNIKDDQYETLTFDAVLICNGHFHSGFIPMYEGAKVFKGKQMHSHEYRKPEVFDDQSVLVVGGNFSAVDIVQQVGRHAASVTWSHHLKSQPDIPEFGGNVIQKPDVMKLREHDVVFVDNCISQPFDVIIYCTGYDLKFPFLSVDCGISNCEEYVRPLFKHCLNINHPTMGFIGLSDLICPNQLFSLQSRFCLTFFTGRKALPSREEMMADWESDLNYQFIKRGLPKKKAHLMGPNVQELYYEDLATTADIDPISPVIPRMHVFTGLCRGKSYFGFRRQKFTVLDNETFEAHPV